ncbi:MAG: hypothetical protein KC656_05355 [Myxococcales bacterium]|nr:hypothetical protein [Myxococcales bacterium]MCB9668844.1 hypothetical protein [Alphaproteobacteria bacterium]
MVSLFFLLAPAASAADGAVAVSFTVESMSARGADRLLARGGRHGEVVAHPTLTVSPGADGVFDVTYPLGRLRLDVAVEPVDGGDLATIGFLAPGSELATEVAARVDPDGTPVVLRQDVGKTSWLTFVTFSR